MKTKHFFLFSLLFFFLLSTSTLAQSSNEFTVSGHIEGIEDGDSIFLFTVEGNIGRIFMKDIIQDGQFLFRGEADSLQELRLTVLGDKFPLKSIPLWIKPEAKIKISGNNHYPSSWCVESNVAEQQQEEIYRAATRSLTAVSDSIFKLYYHEGDKIAKITHEEERLKQRDLVRQIYREHSEISFQEHRIIFKIMLEQPVTAFWVNRLLLFAQSAAGHQSLLYYPEENMKLLQELYHLLDDEQKQSGEGKMIFAYLFPIEKIGIGDKMASGRFFDPIGAEHQITDYLNKGRYLLIDFWGMGCKPCIAAFPEMKQVHEMHNDKITIIGISTDRHAIWMEGVEKYQLPWLNFNDFLELGGYASFYDVHAIPFYVLITPDGTIEDIWMGYRQGMFEELVEKIEKQ